MIFLAIFCTAIILTTTRYGWVESWLYHPGAATTRTSNKAFVLQQKLETRQRNFFQMHDVVFPSSSSDQLFIVPDDQIKQNQKPIDEDVALQERNLRFSGVGRLYATATTEESSSSTSCNNDSNSSSIASSSPHIEVLDRLTKSTVMVVGLGGVGSWAAEALCRSGIGTLILVDLDDICISNTNRQLHATSSSIGKMKLDEMKHRLLDINPHCNVTLIHDFVSVDNVYNILSLNKNEKITALLDAMDGTKEKTALLAACVDLRIPIVTVGAAAGRKDPTKIVVDDLTNVSNDRLLGTCRKNLRKHYNFERGVAKSDNKKIKVTNKKREWKVQAVFSTEVPKPVCQGSDVSSFRRCDGPLGTACFATGTYGFVAASVVVEMIATNKLIYPKKQQQQT